MRQGRLTTAGKGDGIGCCVLTVGGLGVMIPVCGNTTSYTLSYILDHD